MRIFHGDNILQSRQALVAFLDEQKNAGWTVQRLETKSLSLPLLEQALGSSSLFAENKVVVIEELHSGQKSAAKTALIELVASTPESAETSVVLWEKKAMGVGELKKFPTAKVQVFPASKAMFSWLESWSGSPNPSQLQRQQELLSLALSQDGAEFCLTMAAWQLRRLIEVQATGFANGKPANPKVSVQAKSFTSQQLWKRHEKLTRLDINNKTSQLMLDLPRELALWQLER